MRRIIAIVSFNRGMGPDAGYFDNQFFEDFTLSEECTLLLKETGFSIFPKDEVPLATLVGPDDRASLTFVVMPHGDFHGEVALSTLPSQYFRVGLDKQVVDLSAGPVSFTATLSLANSRS